MQYAYFRVPRREGLNFEFAACRPIRGRHTLRRRLRLVLNQEVLVDTLQTVREVSHMDAIFFVCCCDLPVPCYPEKVSILDLVEWSYQLTSDLNPIERPHPPEDSVAESGWRETNVQHTRLH